jgi:anaerobic selenocysteine-containing dehydrogenase
LVRRTAALTLNPEDAHARAIAEGDTVRVFNDLGSVTCHAAVSPLVRPGTVALPKGLWSRHTLNGSTANALAPDTLSDLGAGACFNDARVDVERVAGPADGVAGTAAPPGEAPDKPAAGKLH